MQGEKRKLSRTLIVPLYTSSQVLGLRFGQDMQLYETDPRVSVWAAGNGLLFDVLLLALLTIHLRLINTPMGRSVHLAFGEHCRAAKAQGEVQLKSEGPVLPGYDRLTLYGCPSTFLPTWRSRRRRRTKNLLVKQSEHRR